MHRLIPVMTLIVLSAVLSGCPYPVAPATPVDPEKLSDATTGREYYLYVPSYYTPDMPMPLVITLHGTHGWDGAVQQVKTWQELAEQEGVIVAAPKMRSVQGILPVPDSMWYDDLRADERVVLSLVDDLTRKYSILDVRVRVGGEKVTKKAVLLTGFSAGGYPMYYTGLRNPGRFHAVVARACNSSIEMFEQLAPPAEAKDLPILIFWGKDDLPPLRDQGWDAFRWLRLHGYHRTEKDETKGGHLRRPGVAWRYWSKMLGERDTP